MRIESLKSELKNAISVDQEIDSDQRMINSRWSTFQEDIKQRKEIIESKYGEEIKEYKKQVRLAEEMLSKRRDERKALMDYLCDAKVCEKSHEDLKDFDWESLMKMAVAQGRKDVLDEQGKKGYRLANMNQCVRLRLSDMFELLSTTILADNKIRSKLDEMIKDQQKWIEINGEMERTISKMQLENERINLLVKQCAVSKEPMSEYVTNNVRAKCHSFLESSTTEELLAGLNKFKIRQDKVIQLLRYKEIKLNRDVSLLLVAKDQTIDQQQFYDMQRDAVIL